MITNVLSDFVSLHFFTKKTLSFIIILIEDFMENYIKVVGFVFLGLSILWLMGKCVM